MGIGRNHSRFLLIPVNDEFASEHPAIRIPLSGWIVFIACVRLGVVWAMKGIGRAMRSNETYATVNGIQKRLFAFGGHRRILVSPGFGQYTGRVKMKGVELSQ